MSLDPAATPESPSPHVPRRLLLRSVLSLLVAAGFVWLLQRGALPVLPPLSALSDVAWWAVPVYVGTWSIMHVVRAIRWRWLLAPIAPVSLRSLVSVAWVGFAGVLFMPFRSGEAVRPIMLARRTGLSGWAVTGTIAAERTIDGLLVSAILLVGLATATRLDPLPDHVGRLSVPVSAIPATAFSVMLLFLVAFAVLVVFYRAAPLGRAVLASSLGRVSPRAARWLGTRIERVAMGLAFLPSVRHFAPYLAESVACWALNVLAAWLLAMGCGFGDVTLAHGAVIIGVLALGVMVPNAPGFFGAFQVSVYAALLLFFPYELVESRGATFVFWLYLSQIGITLGAGVVGLALMGTSPAGASLTAARTR